MAACPDALGAAIRIPVKPIAKTVAPLTQALLRVPSIRFLIVQISHLMNTRFLPAAMREIGK